MATVPPDKGKEKLKGGFSRLLSNIGKTIADAASLEVTTFTGTFKYEASKVIRNGVNKVEIENVLKQLTVDNKTDLHLVAYTNVKIDSDISTIVKDDLSEKDAELMKLHMEMLKTSKESREAVISLVKGLL
jgi:hypothetical protein